MATIVITIIVCSVHIVGDVLSLHHHVMTSNMLIVIIPLQMQSTSKTIYIWIYTIGSNVISISISLQKTTTFRPLPLYVRDSHVNCDAHSQSCCYCLWGLLAQYVKPDRGYEVEGVYAGTGMDAAGASPYYIRSVITTHSFAPLESTAATHSTS
jgi:hypothetical protein